MWLQEFYNRFDEAASQTGRPQDLAAVEREVAAVSTPGRIDSSALHKIEESESWGYREWWPRLSENLREPVTTPEDLVSSKSKYQLVSELYTRLQHIEIVSVLLRFICPQEFGIVSPPLIHLIALPPARNHVKYYLRYLKVLRGFADHYEGKWRVADVDMALWSAAHMLTEYPAIAEEMFQDEFFHKVRLENLFAGLGEHYRRTDRGRILLAQAFQRTDYTVGAVIAAKVLDALRKRLPADALGERGITRDKLRDLRKKRNRAVHENPPLSRKESNEFVQEITVLVQAVDCQA